jgi:hypothetical protein
MKVRKYNHTLRVIYIQIVLFFAHVPSGFLTFIILCLIIIYADIFSKHQYVSTGNSLMHKYE